VLTHFTCAFFIARKTLGGKNVEENTIVVPAESTPAEPEVVAPATEEVPAETPEKVEPESRAEKRIKQLVAKQREAEREADYWRGKASQVEVKAQPTQTQAPTVDQFESYDDFLVAKAKHEIKAEQAVQEQKKTVETFEAAFTNRINKVAETEPEIFEIINDRTLPISNPMAYVIKESESAPEIIKYLSRNREESFRISRMNPIAAAREIGKIEFKISNQPKPEPIKKVSQAPEPIKPVESKGTQSVDLDKLPMDEYVKRRNQEQYKRR
jgi:hypothetical protein